MTHACAAHLATCDHCYSCEVLGVCCASGAAAGRSSPSTRSDLDFLREAMAEDAANRTTFAELVYADHLNHSIVELVITAEERTSSESASYSPRTNAPLALPMPTTATSTPPTSDLAMVALPPPRESVLDLLLNRQDKKG